jgi:diamine N-acetyltransferase
MNIRHAYPEEAGIIQELAKKTWPSTFKNILSPSQIEYMLEWMYSIKSLHQQMEEGCIFLIANDKNIDLGFTSFQHNYKSEGVTKLHKIYILPEAQGRGIGNLLLDKVIEESRSVFQQVLSLNVNRDNRAVEFYLKNGFTISRKEDIDIGNGFYMNDFVMEMTL